MRDQIEQYEPKAVSIVAIGDRRVRAFVGDEQPALGSTLWVGAVPTRIVALAGGRRVEALALDTSSFSVGDPVWCADEPAGWPSPRAGRTPLEDLGFEPGRTSAVIPRKRTSDALHTGIEVLDTLLPIAQGGVTLLLDSSAPDACVDRILGTLQGPIVCASSRPVPAASHQILDSSGPALAIAAAWAAEMADAVLVIEAPPFDIDALLDINAKITCIVRVLLRDGLEILAESLDLGQSDTQILLRDDATIDLTRSLSACMPGRFAELAAVRERLAIFGSDELTEEERALLAEANALEAGLAS